MAADSASVFIGEVSEVRIGFTSDSQYLGTLGDKTLGVWDVSDQQEIFRDYLAAAGSLDLSAARSSLQRVRRVGVSV